MNAEEYNRKGYSEDIYQITNGGIQEQYFKNFMLELLNTEIIKAAPIKYSDKSISGLSFDWENTYNVVEIIDQRVQSIDSKYPFIVTVIVTPHKGDVKNPKVYGTDKLTFGVDPYLFDRHIKGYAPIKLIDYKHLKSKP